MPCPYGHEVGGVLVPVDWLKEFVASEAATAQLANDLTMLGLEVENVQDTDGAAVLDIKVTSNRGDCLSVLGVARELAALYDLPLKMPDCQCSEQGPAAEDIAQVDILDGKLCPRYSARVVQGITVRESPVWAQKRLVQCGIRPINAVVDATNLVMLELGQPLHAFDCDRLAKTNGRAHIIVRRARARETIVTLDGVSHDLAAGMLVIADPSGPVALAGVMGGASSEISLATKNALLESAHFDRVSIRRTARALGMNSEASYRFERIVDPGGTVRAVDRVARLIVEFCGGVAARGVLDVYPRPVKTAKITLRPSRVNALLGTRISKDDVADLLRRLGLDVTEGPRIKVSVPSFRPDLTAEVDLVEEVARLHGYNRVPETVAASAARGRQTQELELEERARAALIGLGLNETINYSLDHPSSFDRLNLPADHALRASAIAIKNPKSEDFTILRTTLLGDLLATVRTNSVRGVGEVRAFEIGRVFMRGDAESPPQEKRMAGAVLWGGALASPKSLRDGAGFYAAKGIAEQLIGEFTSARPQFEPDAHPSFHPGRCAIVKVDGQCVGVIGEAAREVMSNYDLRERCWLMELDMGMLMQFAQREPAPRAAPLSRFPPVGRDLALIVAEDVPAQQVTGIIRQGAGSLLERLELFDTYRGQQVPEGHKSLAYSMVFRHAERTLTDAEADEILAAIKQALASSLAARVRE
jgi:phenylalanyl-tRNA synthetase beta chain